MWVVVREGVMGAFVFLLVFVAANLPTIKVKISVMVDRLSNTERDTRQASPAMKMTLTFC